MRKAYVLDTNVLISDPEAIFKFDEHDVHLPIVVIEELDKIKAYQDDLGFSARRASRVLVGLMGDKDMREGISLGEGKGRLFVRAENVTFHFPSMINNADNYILGTALRVGGEWDKADEAVLVSNDVNLRIKAQVLGVKAQEYFADKVSVEPATSLHMLYADTTMIDDIYAGFEPTIEHFRMPIGDVPAEYGCSMAIGDHVPAENGCYVIRSYCRSKSVQMRFVNGRFKRLRDDKPVHGVAPRNAEQRFLIDLLMDRNIDMVVVNGVAGSGKTLLSLAAGLQLVKDGPYSWVMITKVIEPVGKDIGFLPGTLDEKMAAWIKPYHDNLELLMRKSRSTSETDRLFQNVIEIEAITFMRGRSLMDRFIIVDECQNLTPGQIKTVVSRVADSSKIVLLGDLQQIDAPYLNAQNNGLAHVIDKFQGLKNVGVMNLATGERGRIARLAVQRL